jgi:hypothetical protein
MFMSPADCDTHACIIPIFDPTNSITAIVMTSIIATALWFINSEYYCTLYLR